MAQDFQGLSIQHIFLYVLQKAFFIFFTDEKIDVDASRGKNTKRRS